MSQEHTIYFAYGVEISHPGEFPDFDKLQNVFFFSGSETDFPLINYLTAGDSNTQRTFLVAFHCLVGPGDFKTAKPWTAAQYADRDAQLRAAATAVGHNGDVTPAWLVIHDLS